MALLQHIVILKEYYNDPRQTNTIITLTFNYQIIQENEAEILNDPSFVDRHVRFTTLPFKPFVWSWSIAEQTKIVFLVKKLN